MIHRQIHNLGPKLQPKFEPRNRTTNFLQDEVTERNMVLLEQ